MCLFLSNILKRNKESQSLYSTPDTIHIEDNDMGTFIPGSQRNENITVMINISNVP
jgi:hypothetical protein